MLFSKIVAAVDGSESSNKIYDMAAQLANLSNGKLIIVHVVAPPLPLAYLAFHFRRTLLEPSYVILYHTSSYFEMSLHLIVGFLNKILIKYWQNYKS